jgi:hypothetical protein
LLLLPAAAAAAAAALRGAENPGRVSRRNSKYLKIHEYQL